MGVSQSRCEVVKHDPCYGRNDLLDVVGKEKPVYPRAGGGRNRSKISKTAFARNRRSRLARSAITRIPASTSCAAALLTLAKVAQIARRASSMVKAGRVSAKDASLWTMLSDRKGATTLRHCASTVARRARRSRFAAAHLRCKDSMRLVHAAILAVIRSRLRAPT